VPLKIPHRAFSCAASGDRHHSRMAERLLQMIVDQWRAHALSARAALLSRSGAKRQSRVRPDSSNRDCDDNGSGFGRSAYEMRR
jgi:hypothetical protein